MIKYLEEKKGGIHHIDKDNELLKEVIHDLNLIDLYMVNGTLTQTNHRGGSQQTASLLDRFLISETLMKITNVMEATIVPHVGSKHWPNCLSLNTFTQASNPFRFEKLWLKHPSFKETLQGWWNTTIVPPRTIMYQFQQRLKIIKKTLRYWNKEVLVISFKNKNPSMTKWKIFGKI